MVGIHRNPRSEKVSHIIIAVHSQLDPHGDGF